MLDTNHGVPVDNGLDGGGSGVQAGSVEATDKNSYHLRTQTPWLYWRQESRRSPRDETRWPVGSNRAGDSDKLHYSPDTVISIRTKL